MRNYPGIYDAKADLLNYLVDGPKLPQETKDAVKAALNQGSPVDAIAQGAEALYAVRDKLDNNGREIVAGISTFLSANSLHSYEGGRGQAIALAMMRDNKEKAPLGYAFPKKADDPDVSDQFKPAPAAQPDATTKATAPA